METERDACTDSFIRSSIHSVETSLVLPYTAVSLGDLAVSQANSTPAPVWLTFRVHSQDKQETNKKVINQQDVFR